MVTVALLTASSCGSRLSDERLLADAGAGGNGSGFAAGPQSEPGSSADRSDLSGPVSGPDAGSSAQGGDRGADASTGAGGERSAGSGSGAGGGATAAGCTERKAPIVIGAVGHQSGVLGAIYADVPKAIQGWVAWKNSQGGIKCHPIRFVTRDDGGDPARMQALTKELVEKERVIAMVGQHAPITGGATVDYITQKRIPMIGSAGTESHFYDRSPMYFPQQPSGILRYLAQVAVARDIALPQGKKKLGTLACQESTECAEASDVSARYADKYGLQMAYQARASIAQPDYTSNCQAAQSAGVEMLLVYLDSASAERVARSCASINYRPTFATTAVAENLAANKQLDGLLAGVVNGIWFDNGNPAIAEYRSILQKYAPGARLSTYSVAGWAAAELFEVAAANISDQPSSEDLLKGLWAIKGNDLGGLTQPLTFVSNKPSSPREMCYWIVQTRAGQWISPNGSKRTCTEGIVP